MNDRYRNRYKAVRHIRMCREKEKVRTLVPFFGYVNVPTEKLLAARIRQSTYSLAERMRKGLPAVVIKHIEIPKRLISTEMGSQKIEERLLNGTKLLDSQKHRLYIDGKQVGLV